MRYIDLSYSINNSMPTYPSDPDVSIICEKNIDSHNSLLHSIKLGTHTGTHLDVPSHIIKGGKTIDCYPLSTFTGLAVKVEKNTYKQLDNIDKDINGIIYDSGHYKNYKNSNIYFGSDRPAIPMALIEKCIDHKIKFFGCDLPSVDASGSTAKPIHHKLLRSDIIIYEALNNLSQLPSLKPFLFYGFPLPLDKLDGSPVRAVACLE